MSEQFAIAVGRFYRTSPSGWWRARSARSPRPAHEPADVYDVPGAFELPLAARYLADRPAATPASPASAR